MTTTTDHATEQAHDTKYYELLQDEYAAWAKLQQQRDRLIEDAAVKGRGGFAQEFSGPEAAAEAGLPVGAIYAERTGGYGYGDRGYRVVTERNATATMRQYDHVATAADALALLPADHERVVAYDAAREQYDAAAQAVTDHDAEGYTGWTRYMLVTSSTGHVHRDMNCSTCRPTTQFAPVVSLSGCNADEAIDLLGETLCSVCYPDAPIAGKAGKITKAAAKKLLAGK